MLEGNIIVIDKVEDDSYDGKEFKKVTDKAGNKFNVKSGRGGALKEKWPLLQEGIAIKLQVGEFNGKPFVKDFTVVKDEFVAQAATEVQKKVKVDKEESIEAQVGQKGGIEVLKTLIDMGKLNEEELQECAEYAMASVRWGMGRVNLPSVIVTKIEEATIETNKAGKSSQETQTEPVDRQDGGEATDEERVNGFLKYLENHGIKDAKVFLSAEYGIDPAETLTPKKCEALYKTIKKDKKW